jgi:hypothetical protein
MISHEKHESHEPYSYLENENLNLHPFCVFCAFRG